MSDTGLQTGRDLSRVLDKGFVKLIDFMGGDQRAVDSARVSFGSVSKGEAADRKLLEYLLEHGHFSPFEHSVFQFHIKCPIFVARQWMRHRIASYNEISARYTEVHDEFYFPEVFRAQDRSNRQGSLPSSNLDQKKMLELYDKAVKASYAAYQELLDAGAAREMARMVLPVAQYTQFHWTINARSLLNFISLRADDHAQWEIRRYAEAIQEMFRARMPWTWEAWSKLNEKKAH
ncbi:MAG: FAD-dependent thymidylate synthase [Elusimicrobia bacterium GWC2_64_44]|nr:MAG: FAD-dependent thymidylate synthase [Elusimicrobia bacterium GWC2_64_44]